MAAGGGRCNPSRLYSQVTAYAAFESRSVMSRRRARKRCAAAVQIAVIAAVILVVPLFVTNPVLRPVVTMLWPLGWVLAGTAAILWRISRDSSRDGRTSPWPIPPFARARTPLRPSRHDRAEVSRTPWTDPMRTIAPQTWSREVFDQIEWHRFEAVIESLFQQAGFKTKSQSHGADGGVDVWLYSRQSPDRPVGIVQCKHWHSTPVGVDKMRELRGVMASHKLSRGHFATTSTFTEAAASFGSDNGIHLLDTTAILKLIARRTPEQQAELLNVALTGDYGRPTCVKCGTKMIERLARGNGKPFWGCTRYPKCRFTMPMRNAKL